VLVHTGRQEGVGLEERHNCEIDLTSMRIIIWHAEVKAQAGIQAYSHGTERGRAAFHGHGRAWLAYVCEEGWRVDSQRVGRGKNTAMDNTRETVAMFDEGDEDCVPHLCFA
jgi:hypothetical protein